MSDAAPNLPRSAQVQIGRRLRTALASETPSELPEAMQAALQALEVRLSRES